MARAFSQAHYRDTDKALAAFQKAVDLDSARAHAHYNIGLVYAYRDSNFRAEQAYQRALSADSTLSPPTKSSV